MGYGTVEEGRKQPSGVRNTRVLIIVAALGIVALTCVVTVGLQRAGGRYSLLGEVAVPAGDFTSSADERAYSAYFTQLDASEAKSHQKQEAADSKHQPDTVAQKPRSADAARSDLDSFFDSLSAAKKRLDKGLSSMQAVKNLDDIFPTHEAKDKAKQLAQDHKDAQAAISASKAQADLDGYFDAMGAGLHKKKQIGITREQAAKDVVSMFPSSSAKRAHSKPAAKSAMSAAKAQADLDGYFREMQPETKKHLTHSSATKSTQSDSETHHKWSNQSPEVQDYIAKKRVTIEHNGGFTDVAANGQVVKTSERWSSANARKELDGYFGGDMNKRLQAHHAEHSAKIASHGHSASMNSFIDHHPDFQKQLDMVGVCARLFTQSKPHHSDKRCLPSAYFVPIFVTRACIFD